MVSSIQERNGIFNGSDFVFCESFDERLHKDTAPIKSSIKPYHVQRDLELEFELELEERLNNDLAQERYYIQASR